MTRNQLLSATCLLIGMVSFAATGAPASPQGSADGRVAAGVWGGMHLVMNVQDQGATLEFDCARGTVPEPLTVNGKGEFRVHGSFFPEHAGPTRRDENEGTPAIYSGTVTGDNMSLKLEIGGQPEVRTFELKRGRNGRLMKCR